MATATIQAPGSYLLSSQIGDVGISLTDADSATVTVVAGSTDEVLSLELDAYDGLVTLCDLRSAVEEYMRSEERAMQSFTIKVYDEDSLLASCSFTAIYCALSGKLVNASTYLLSHFLTSLTHKITHRTLLERISYFAKAGETRRCDFLVVSAPAAGGSQRVDTLSSYVGLTQGADSVVEIIVDYDDIVTRCNAAMSNWYSGDWKILAVTVSVGNRSFCFYYSDKVPSVAFTFRNAFNVFEVCGINGITSEVTTVERSTAVIGGKSEFYDQTETTSYEVESAPMQLHIAKWIRQLFASHAVFIHQRSNSAFDYPVLITDSKCEVNDENGSLNAVKFTWQYEDGMSPIN